MRVGALEESVTVSAQSPIVDVQSAVHTQVLNREALDSIPTGKTIQGLGQLIVGVNLNLPDTGGARGAQQTYMSTHGMSAANTTVMVDGMTINGLQSDGAVQTYVNTEMNQEVSYQTSGISAENSSGGVRLNMIPREGGNTFSGSFNASYRPGDWQADNVSQRLIDAGLPAGGGNATDKIAEYTFGQGGPIVKDKVWFFTSGRYFRVNNFIADTFFDDGSQGIDDQLIKSAMVRMTWQASPKNKLSAYFDEVDKYRGHDMQSQYRSRGVGDAVVLARVPHPTGEMDLDGHEQAPPRGGLLEQYRGLHQQLSGRDRAALRLSGMVRQRRALRARPGRGQHGRSAAEYAEPGPVQCAGLGLLRDRLPQRQDRRAVPVGQVHALLSAERGSVSGTTRAPPRACPSRSPRRWLS